MLGPARSLSTSLILIATASSSASLAIATSPPQDPPPVRVYDGQEAPVPFVPLHPRTAQERDRQDALQLYVQARALEDQRRWDPAIALLEKALLKDPESVPILRHLSRLNRALGRVDESVRRTRKALELDPGETESLSLLVGHLLAEKNDVDATEAMLRGVLANPRLKPDSAGATLAHRILGDLEVEFRSRPDLAADQYALVLKALDDRAAVRLPQSDQQRILRNDAGESYFRFGEVFLRAGRPADAITALRRGLAYDPDHAQIPRFLAEAQLRLGSPEEALTTLEGYLKRQPQGREPYELLGEIFTALKRDGDFLPRLEQAAKADPKNISLQFALAEQLRASDRGAEADDLLRDLLKKQGDPQVFGPLAASLLKERRTDELFKLLSDAVGRRGGPEAIKPQLDAIAQDKPYAVDFLAAGLKALQADPPVVEKVKGAITVLAYIARNGNQVDSLIELDRITLLRNPSAQGYRELFFDLYRNGRYDDASRTIRELIEKYPAERTPMILGALARSEMFAGRVEGALESAREAAKVDPNDLETQFLIGYLLGRLERNAEAIDHYRSILDRFPNNDEVERRARSGLSAIYVNLEDFAKGEAELELLLAKSPDDAGVNNDLGYLYADQGKNLEKAETMVRKAVEEDPKNASYLDSLGWVLFKRDKLAEAVSTLERAAAETTVDATILDHLGDVYYKLQNYDKSRKAWTQAEQMAAKSTPPDKRLTNIRKKIAELDKLMSSSQPDRTDAAKP